MAIDYGAASKAEYITRRPFFTAGKHLCRILAIRTQVGKTSGADQYVAEFEVLESTPVPLADLTAEELASGVQKNAMSKTLPAGDQRAWLIANDGKQKQMFYPKIKQLNDAIKLGVFALTKCTDAEGNPLMTVAEAKTLGPDFEGKATGWDLTQPGATGEELRHAVEAQMAAGQCLWVNVTRQKTKAGVVIDGVDFLPLLPSDIVKYDAVLEYGATSAE